jgi:predicted nuclease of predicted toxin-antitoxin system
VTSFLVVLAFARTNDQVVLTEDRRFGFIAIGSGPPNSVLVLLLGDTSPADKAARVISVLPGILDSLSDAVTVIGPTNVRRRPL